MLGRLRLSLKRKAVTCLTSVDSEPENHDIKMYDVMLQRKSASTLLDTVTSSELTANAFIFDRIGFRPGT